MTIENEELDEDSLFDQAVTDERRNPAGAEPQPEPEPQPNQKRKLTKPRKSLGR
jgi:hypothetical protein